MNQFVHGKNRHKLFQMTATDLKHPVFNIPAYWFTKLLYCHQEHSFGYILQKFDANFRFITDFVSFLNSKSGIGNLGCIS